MLWHFAIGPPGFVLAAGYLAVCFAIDYIDGSEKVVISPPKNGFRLELFYSLTIAFPEGSKALHFSSAGSAM